MRVPEAIFKIHEYWNDFWFKSLWSIGNLGYRMGGGAGKPVRKEMWEIFAKMAKITDEQIDAWEQEIILTNHPTYPAKDFQSCVRDKINKIRDIMKELEKVKEVFDYDAEIDRLKSEHDFIAFSGDGECENCNGWDMESDRCECGCCRVCWMVEDDYVYASSC